MTDNDKTARLGAAYTATRPEEIAQIYDAWAESYDADMAKVGYRHPAICLAHLARHVAKGEGPVLDAGCGTGLIGEWLAICGYRDAHGLDLSEGMLKMATGKQVYASLTRAALGTALPFPDHHFAAIVSAGVFTTGHVGAEGLDDLLRICRPGGVIVLTVKDGLWQGGFSARVAALEAAGRLTLTDDTGPYVSMPGEAGTAPSRCVTMRVC